MKIKTSAFLVLFQCNQCNIEKTTCTSVKLTSDKIQCNQCLFSAQKKTKKHLLKD
jgi:transcription elongation factor Elf1